MKFAVALGRSPGHGPDKARRAYNFLPKHTTEYDLKAIEKKIMHKLEDRCEVRRCAKNLHDTIRVCVGHTPTPVEESGGSTCVLQEISKT